MTINWKPYKNNSHISRSAKTGQFKCITCNKILNGVVAAGRHSNAIHNMTLSGFKKIIKEPEMRKNSNQTTQVGVIEPENTISPTEQLVLERKKDLEIALRSAEEKKQLPPNVNPERYLVRQNENFPASYYDEPPVWDDSEYQSIRKIVEGGRLLKKMELEGLDRVAIEQVREKVGLTNKVSSEAKLLALQQVDNLWLPLIANEPNLEILNYMILLWSQSRTSTAQSYDQHNYC